LLVDHGLFSFGFGWGHGDQATALSVLLFEEFFVELF
jgi:hypothetical protein